MIVKTLGLEERVGLGASHKITLTNADLTGTTSGTAQTIALLSLGVGQKVTRAKVDLETEFTGGALTALTCTVGDGGDVDRFVASASLLTGATPITVKDGTGTACLYDTADTVDAVITPTSAAVSAATAGKLNIYLLIEDSIIRAR